MQVPFSDSARYRWQRKPVEESRLLDPVEDLKRWSQRATYGYGDPAEPQAEIALSAERAKQGKYSLRFRSKTTGEKPGPQLGRPFGSESVFRVFEGEDWQAFNRLSFWVYPDLPGFRTVSFLVSLYNDGELQLPGRAGVTPGVSRLGLNFLVLENQEWNHVVWEIPDLPRDKVTRVEFQYRLQGHEPGATDTVTFYIDRLELQRVATDHFEGWDVAPGRIAYSHSGYQPGAKKVAFASDLEADTFVVITEETGEAALSKPVSRQRCQRGEFQMLDFSELRRPGVYTIRASDRRTRPFRIAADVWADTLWKSVNYFYCQRCGDAIPGIHDVCHRDWLGVHGDKRIVINGGWHDAGDACQGLANTGEAVYAMYSLAERFQRRGEHPALARRLMEEGRWGLEWILKTSFGDGARIVWATHDYWTNGIIGDVDDVTAVARNDPEHNFIAAAAEALAARLHRPENPAFARLCLQRAKADWRFAVAAKPEGRQRLSSLKLAAAGVLASVDLFRATGGSQYRDEAVRLAGIILDHQQRRYFRELDTPLAGFFWESADKEFPLHESHLGDMHGPALALVRLCEIFPDHPQWIRWYSAVVLYSEYLKETAQYTQPYRMLPESLYREDEHLRLPEEPQNALGYRLPTRKDFREQVLNGVKLGSRFRLRLFPVWFERRGNHGIILPKAKALGVAAHLRRDLESAQLAEEQLEWVVGRNPFAQTTMTGEGHDFLPHYSAMSGDIVGSLPVGIETYRNRDIPYWPVHNHMNTKETWVLPVAQWIWNMRELAGPALVRGRCDTGARGPVRFRETQTGELHEAIPEPANGEFEIWLPRGSYEVSHEQRRTSITALPAATVHLDLRDGSFLDFRLSHSVTSGKRLELRVDVTGQGRRHFTIRSDNIRFQESERIVDLADTGSASVSWTGEIELQDAPWVVVVIPDHDITRRQEIVGLRP